MKIDKVIASPGLTGFYNDDQEAIRRGAEEDGFVYLGEPVTPGFTSIRQRGESVSIMLVLDDGQVAFGDCASVQYAGVCDRDPPFSASALTKHIAALLSNVLQIGEVVFNVRRAAVVYGGRKRHLTPKQARLLETFMRHEGQVLTRAFLMKQVWDTDYLGDTRTLDVHVSWLRKAIEKNPGSPVYLRTIRGVGYCFEEPEQ